MFPFSGINEKEIIILTDSGVIPSFYVRWIDPLAHLTKNYNVFTSSDAEAAMLSGAVHLVIVHRWFDDPIRKIAEKAKQRNIPLVYETDDNFMALSPSTNTLLSGNQIANIEHV